MKEVKLSIAILLIVFSGYSQDSTNVNSGFSQRTSGLLIEVNQQPITILSQSKYAIFVNGEQYYSATKSYLHIITAFRLFNYKNKKQILAVKNHFFRYKNRYKIVRSDNSIIEWKTVELFKRHHRCLVNGDTYDIYGHKGRKFSIYKNNVQIAWWDKNLMALFAGDQYKIIADSDCDKELIVTFCIIIDQFKDDGSKGELNLDFGNVIVPEVKPFDPTWRPK